MTTSASTSPILSVVIPTLGRPILVQTLRSLAASKEFENIEVIVAGRIADEQVRRDVEQLVAEHSNIRWLPVSYPVGDSSEKKNAGLREARSDIVAFLDDDVAVAPQWPRKMLDPFKDPGISVVSGPSLVPLDVGLFARLAGLALSSPAAGYVSWRYRAESAEPVPIKWSKIIGCNMAYRKDVLLKLGGFDPVFWPGEEMISAFRAQQQGHRIVFSSEAYVYHYPRQSLRRFWKQIHGYGATRIRLFRGGVDIESSTIVPAIWVASLVVLGLGSLFSRMAFWLLELDLALYALVDLWVTMTMYLETKRPCDLLLFFLVPMMHLSYGIGAWVEFFRPNKDLSERPAR